MWRKRLKAILLPSLLCLSLTVLLGVLAHFLIHTDAVQHYLLKQLSQATGYKLSAEEITLNFRHGIGIQARNFRVSTTGGHEKAGAARVRMSFNPGELLKGRIVPTELVILDPEIYLNPEIHLAAKEDHPLSLTGQSPVFEKSYTRILAAFPLVSLENAHVVLNTAGVAMKNLNIRLAGKSKDPLLLEASFHGTAFYNGATAPFSGKGVIRENSEKGFLIDARFNVKEIPMTHLPLPEELSVQKGVADIHAVVKGSPDGILSMDGKLAFKGLDFLLVDDADKKAFSFNRLTLPFNASYVDSVLRIPFFQIQNAAFTLNGASTFDFTHPSGPHLDLKVKSPFMTLGTFKRIFPSSLLPAWLETRIFPIFSGGDVCVDLFSLNGPWHRLENLDLRENADLLRLQITCKGITAFKDEQALQVDRVSGDLEIRKGEIHVSGVNGHFGESTIETGSLLLKDLYVDDPHIRVTASGSFRVEDLMTQTHLKLIPPEVRAKFHQIKGASGKLDGDVVVVYEPGWHFPKIETGMLTFLDCTLDDPDIPFKVLIKEGALTITPEDGKNFVAEGQWGKSRIRANPGSALQEAWETTGKRGKPIWWPWRTWTNCSAISTRT